MTEEIHLKWYHTFLFLFQAGLSVADIITDALTCAKYYKISKVCFGIGLALIILPLLVTCIWSIVASTTRTLDRDNEDMNRREVDLFFRSIPLNVCLSCACFGPTFHSLELFLFCTRNFRILWKTEGGMEVKKDDGPLYYLFIHNKNMKLVEGLLESGPQLLLQLYVMVKYETLQEECMAVRTLYLVSVSISFLSLTYTITSSEVLTEYSGRRNPTLWQSILIFIGNVALMAGRAGAFVFFAITVQGYLSLIVSVHWLIVVLMGFVLWNSKRIQHIVKFIFCHSLSYIFVFRTSPLSYIRSSTKPMSKVTRFLATTVWYILFAAENSAMILWFYVDQGKSCFNIVVLVVVLGGTYGGMIVKSLVWFCFSKQHSPEDETADASRGPTMLVKSSGQGVRVRKYQDSDFQTL